MAHLRPPLALLPLFPPPFPALFLALPDRLPFPFPFFSRVSYTIPKSYPNGFGIGLPASMMRLRCRTVTSISNSPNMAILPEEVLRKALDARPWNRSTSEISAFKSRAEDNAVRTFKIWSSSAWICSTKSSFRCTKPAKWACFKPLRVARRSPATSKQFWVSYREFAIIMWFYFTRSSSWVYN